MIAALDTVGFIEVVAIVAAMLAAYTAGQKR